MGPGGYLCDSNKSGQVSRKVAARCWRNYAERALGVAVELAQHHPTPVSGCLGLAFAAGVAGGACVDVEQIVFVDCLAWGVGVDFAAFGEHLQGPHDY